MHPMLHRLPARGLQRLTHLASRSASRQSPQNLAHHRPPPPSACYFYHAFSPSSTLSQSAPLRSSSSSSSSAAAAAAAPPHTGEAWVPSIARAIPGHSSTVDPFHLVACDLDAMTASLRATVSVLQHPTLDRAASHLLSLRGKRVRPLIVLLMAHATSLLSHGAGATVVAASSVAGAVPSIPSPSSSSSLPDSPSPPSPASMLLPSQLRLAEITELIHAASLLHDDVIDVADTRRGALSVNSLFGNQLAVLAGDFLLARASVALARLRDCDVVELLSTVIEHLVRGEVLQMRGGAAPSGGIADPAARRGTDSDAGERASSAAGEDRGGGGDDDEIAWFHRPEGPFETYLAKTFFKTASLVANSSRAVVMLAGHPPAVCDAAYRYGENVGMAFQLVDDVLDMSADAATLGKPVLHDLRQGVVTAPVLFAMERFPQLREMADRKFARDGDVDFAVECVEAVGGVQKTQELARRHVNKAVDVLVNVVPPSEHRSALINLADFVLRRSR